MKRFAIVGTGIIGMTHIATVNATEGAVVAAIAEINEEKAKEAAAKCDCPYFLDYKKIDVPIDAAIINLPHFLHDEAACFFLEKGIDVLVEKPMATTYAECLHMTQTAQKNGAKLAVAHVQRYFTGNEIVKKFFEEKTFGELAMTNERRNIFYFNDSRPRWFLNKKLSGGGIFMNYGAHGLDRLMYIMGANVTEISANCTHLLPDFDVEGHAQVFVKFDNGVSSVMTYCGYRGFDVDETTFYFTNGTVRFNFPGSIEVAVDGKFEPYPYTHGENSFKRQLIDFIKYTNGEESNIPTPEYGAKIIRAIEKTYEMGEGKV